MGIANEIEFENDICAHLAAHGWLYSPNDIGYNRELALFPEDALAWVTETQPKAWSALQSFNNSGVDDFFLTRLVKVLETEGTLHVLRNGFKAAGIGASTFSTVEFKPAFGFNAEVAERYRKNRLRVMRQVHYSVTYGNCIDLVLFMNGIPVATIELKTDFTQTVEDAKRQYKKDRLPKDAKTHKPEPLLTFKRGALVHFAVSTEEVWMTTKLAGESTYFLPFNKGNNGGKGNAVSQIGYSTAYLWEEIFQFDTWLRLIGSFIQFESKAVQTAKGPHPNPPVGKEREKRKEALIFPRYHQFAAVTRAVEDARSVGAGHNYLFQHSAGSGKSNTIGWCAHQLASLHNKNDEKVFDTVIIITDRTVLDAQLKDTIKQFESTKGVVVSIDSEKGSKSGQLAEALKKDAMIVVVTIQTFPFILNEIKQSATLAAKRFAVIIDEAHSSQGGTSARNLRSVLSSTVTEEDEVTVEDMLTAEAEGRTLPKNASFLAFTATPKSKTLEAFGRRETPDSMPRPFHEYTMRQAIEEGFILDVLQNYTPYRVAYKLAHNGKDWDDVEVDKSTGVKALYRWVRLHPHNIAQKVEIIVEHFRSTVAQQLNGHAKAMVVTDSRQAAVRYKLAMDSYIKRSGYKDIATIVAFSGELVDLESGPEKFSEGSMNKLHGRSIRGAFETEEFQVLIVANKFQTGFDQPLLVAMYVDKRIDGIQAVQTLSRLNRTYPGKDSTFVLDFVNDAETIRLAFEPYYEHTDLAATTDPNLVYDLVSRLDAETIYSEQDALHVSKVHFAYEAGHKQGQKELVAALSAPVDRFKVRWQNAEVAHDKETLDRLTTFHKNLGSFCRLYDFISQIVRYDDPGLEARYILYKHLEPLIRPENIRQLIDLSAVQLTHYKLLVRERGPIYLGTKEDEDHRLQPISDVGTHTPRDPVQAKLSELVESLNSLFEDESLTDADRVGLFNHVADKMMENAEITKQAQANSKEQFSHSPTIQSVVVNAVIAAMDSYEAMGKKVFQDQAAMQRFQALLTEHVYDRVNEPPAT